MILFFINIKTMFIRSADRSKKAIYGFYIISPVVAILATYFYIPGASWSIELLIPLIFCIIGVACVVEMPKRNKAGNSILGKILGLKKFIEVSEANRIKTLIKENPNYCFNLIPYAIVLGVCKEWILKFQQLMPQNPDWYQGQFNAHSIANFSYNLSTLSAPSYNNGGISRSSSSGGGGFSGGGGGGGGGSSW